MTTWGGFAAAAPDLAAEGRRLLYAQGHGEALLATVRGDSLPRIHPISVGIVGDRLYAFIIVGSPKHKDLELDGRYAMHTHQDPAAPNELMFQGRARLADDPDERALAADGWFFDVDDDYTLFEFAIERVILGERATADDWPPVYSSWPVRPKAAKTPGG
jgi:Pyridoxamine 5'-phosphate oxidase